MNPTQQDVQDAFQKLYDGLNDAYWAASTIQDKDRLRGAADVIFEILSQLTVSDIRSRSIEFSQLKATFDSVQARLEKLQKDIDGIIHNVSVATNVVAGITKALELAGKFLA
jgi:hypothetical protein